MIQRFNPKTRYIKANSCEQTSLQKKLLNERNKENKACASCACCNPLKCVVNVPTCDTSSNCCDVCAEQMKYVLEQLLDFYSAYTWEITFISGNSITLTPDQILTTVNQGVLFDTATNQYINICQIAIITIEQGIYEPSIQYLPAPITEPTCGCAYSIYSVLQPYQQLRQVNFFLGTYSTGLSDFLFNKIGMVVIMNAQKNLQFINTCAVDSFIVGPA